MTMPAKKAAKNVDVTPPGKSRPDSTSRPVIISHGPMMADPMVKTADQSEAGEQVIAVRSKVIAVPKTDDDTLTEDKLPAPAAEAGEVADQPETDKPAATNSSDDGATDQPRAPAVAEPAIPDSDLPEINDRVEARRQQTVAEKAGAERQAQINTWIEQKKYFVPIKAHHHGRSHRLVMFICVLVALVLGLLALIYYKIPGF